MIRNKKKSDIYKYRMKLTVDVAKIDLALIVLKRSLVLHLWLVAATDM